MTTTPAQPNPASQSLQGVSPDLIDNPDPIGAETLRRIYQMDNLNRWMWSRVEPWVGSHVLEAGCGTGTMTAFLLTRAQVCCVDMNEEHLADLRRQFDGSNNLETFTCDLQDTRMRELAGRGFDTVVCLNVLEHVLDHETTLDNFHSILEPGGRLVLLVPAYSSLYGTLDKGLSHHRRYDKKELLQLLGDHGFSAVHHRYLNTFGIMGWWLNGRVLKRTLLPSGQLTLYNRLVPLFMLFENLTGPPWGLSHVICAEKD